MKRTTLRTRLAAVATFGAIALAITGCGSSGTSTSASTAKASSSAAPATAATAASIKVVNFSFSPSTVTVKVGGTVTWHQVDSTGHSILSVSKPEAWTKSAVLKPGQTFSHTFAAAGTYPYICGVHNYMMGTVVVVK